MPPNTNVELYRRIAALERDVSQLKRRGKAYGWQLSSVFDMHRYGGGKLMWGFDGQSEQIAGQAENWHEAVLGLPNYGATTYGGPYVSLDGAAEYLWRQDGGWQESADEEFLVWCWCYPTTLAALQYIAAKWDTAGGAWRSWRLLYNNGAGAFQFSANPTGAAIADVPVTSTYIETVDEWHFVAGYFEPSTLLRIYVGQNTDIELTIDSVVVGVPAQLYDDAADLTIGATGNPNNYFTGNIGRGAGRANVPSADIDDHVNMLFQSTREFYEE